MKAEREQRTGKMIEEKEKENCAWVKGHMLSACMSGIRCMHTEYTFPRTHTINTHKQMQQFVHNHTVNWLKIVLYF
jgi:hypothetical protein